MDSCVTAALAAAETETYAVHFSYGQRTEAREFEAARAIARRLKLSDFLHLKIDLFRHIGGSALTDSDIAVPDAGPSHTIGESVPVTYVPFRNAHFLSAAVSWAEVIGATRIYIGAVEQDSSGYPDCRPPYYAAFQQLLSEHSSREGVLVVGHNPNLHQFLARLISGNGQPAGGGTIRVRKGAVARIDLGKRPAQLQWLIDPRLARVIYASVTKSSRPKTSRK